MTTLRKAKIIATIGPASNSEDVIKDLLLSGVNVFRLNFSHGNHEMHKNTAAIIRKVEQDTGISVAILADLQGPKIRIGVFEDGSISLKHGSKFILDSKPEFGNARRVSLPHPELLPALKEGTDLLLDDGKIKLKVTKNTRDSVETEVIQGGTLSNKKGLNIPNAVLPINSLTDKDLNDISIINEMGVDWVAVSFVQTASDIVQARKMLKKELGIIAKIEKPLAIENIDSILKETDAIMIARGDLGVELPYESIPGMQRHLINKARYKGKPAIVATQMLESMNECHIPTRAEVSDVAYAVAEGADAVMLSSESASGKYPVEAVQAMDKIIRQAEQDKLDLFDKNFKKPSAIAEAVCSSVSIENIKTVAIFTKTGECINSISNCRPDAVIVAFSPSLGIIRRLNLLWGIYPVLVDETFSFSQILEITESVLCNSYGLTKGDKTVIAAGLPFATAQCVNFVNIHLIDGDFGESKA